MHRNIELLLEELIKARGYKTPRAQIAQAMVREGARKVSEVSSAISTGLPLIPQALGSRILTIGSISPDLFSLNCNKACTSFPSMHYYDQEYPPNI